MYSDTQLREVFHFCFLERLLKLTEPGLYALKDGVNLRFYFNSPRYSEDMDLDVFAGSVDTLKKNGDKILNDASFKRSLRTYGIEDLELNDPTKAKHTKVTQRFRFGLVTSAGHRLPTKVEFSRRQRASDSLVTELIDPELARQYRKLSFRAQHYPGEIAAIQKFKALYGRKVTQARDVFDIGILYAGGFINAELIKATLSKAQKQQAADCVMSLSFSEFEGQVVEFLLPENQQDYRSLSAWERLQDTVLSLINPPD